jgi:ArsR family transcriptional regulator, arsenate/arsenite/antimonite-responsive transcriptional repressor / arsenate reductase (thioredoxin)
MKTISLTSEPPDFLKLLGHDLRWKLVSSLSHGDHRVQELVSLLNQPQNLVSYHLKQLRDAQLLAERRSTADGRDIYYSLNLEKLQALYGALGTALHPAFAVPELPENSGPGQAPNVQPTRVLFLCTENSARSQMVEGLLRQSGGSTVEVFSAGTAPSTVHPIAIRTLAEMGIDISQQQAKHLDIFRDQGFDYIITVCDRAREACPVFSEDAEAIHWSLADPAAVIGEEAQAQAFAQTAQQLTVRIRYLLALIHQQKVVSQ